MGKPLAAFVEITPLDPAVIVLWNKDRSSDGATADDAYAGYEIPDDLTW